MYNNIKRISIQKATAVVAVIALALAAIKFATKVITDARYSTFAYGKNTSVFVIGERVIPTVDTRTVDYLISAGTPCVVVSDPPDEDSAYPDRPVKIRIDDRGQRGPTFLVKRRYLRGR